MTQKWKGSAAISKKANHLQGLLEVSQLVRSGTFLPAILESIARVVAETLDFDLVVISLYRPPWDNFEVAAVHGSDQARETLLGQTLTRDYWDPLLDARFERCGAHFVPHDQRDWDADAGTWFVPPRPALELPGAWHPADALLVPLRASDGSLLAILSVNEPRSGRRPGNEVLEVLAALASHAGQAIQSAQEAKAASRHGAMLEHLFVVSSELMRGHSTETLLQLICDAVQAALGYGLAVIELADPETNRYRPVAAAGIDLESVDVQLTATIDEFDRLFEPQFEVEGCFLVPRDEALARVPTAASLTLSSTMNGRGPHAWDRHWLVVPLFDRSGERMGFIWADDPIDRLLPSRERLQTLRLFANQAMTALESAAQLEELRHANELSRAVIDASPLAVVSLDSEDRVQLWNPAAERMYGWTVEEAVGGRQPQVPDEAVAEFDELVRRVRAGESLTDVELVRVRKDGSEIVTSMSTAAIRDASGEVAGVVSMIADVSERRRAQEELARQNAELEALHDTSLDLIGRLDPHAVLETILRRACALLGTEHGSLYVHDPAAGDLVLEVGLGVFTPFLGTRLPKGVGLSGLTFETGQQQTLDDYSAWKDAADDYESVGIHASSCVPIRVGGEIVAVFGVVYDDRERRFGPNDRALLERFGRMASLALENARLYESARKNEELYRKVFETSIDMISLLSPSGEILFASPSCEQLLGYTPNELAGLTYADLMHPDDVPGVAATIGAALSGERAIPTLARVQHRDGHWLQMEGTPAPVYGEDGYVEMLLAVVRDVTERTRQERELRESRELYRTVVENANDLIALFDPDGFITYASPSHAAVLGFEPHELVGQHVATQCHPDDAAASQAADDAVRASGSSTWDLRVRHKDGRWVTLEGASKAIPGPDGRPRMILSTSRDVTQQRVLEEQLRGAQRMEAIGRLAGGVAHDFNNLLTAIGGYGELALAQLSEHDPVHRHVAEMRRAGERAASLTRQLLAFSRRQVLQPKVLDLNEVVTGLDGLLSRLLGADVKLMTKLDSELGTTKADPSQIEQVVMNLAVNARDAMPRGGLLRIETANVELDEEFAATHVGAAPGPYVCLSVADSGEGMDRETLARAFEPFFTTKPVGEGTGLGLSTVYGIVKQTGGQIWAYSEPGRGTTFKVYLPRVWEPASARDEEELAQSNGAGSGTILLVEDETVVRELVTEMLEMTGYDVIVAEDGEAAIAAARAHDGEIDVLMTDVVMPGLSGPEVAGVIGAERPSLGVLFTSGYTEEAIASQGSLRPGAAFLEKPFSAAQLKDKLHDVLTASGH